VDVGEERLKHPDPLTDPCGYEIPFGRADDPGYEVGEHGPLENVRHNPRVKNRCSTEAVMAGDWTGGDGYAD
jgi:hypothetical protein